jgi:ribosome maturation factor RimP
MDASTIVKTTVSTLGFELVDFERGGGMFKVYIDKPQGITVEDCAAVSNQLTRVFLVESIDFERLEVSSPGLDRPLKTSADFERFIGVRAKVRLHHAVDARKRFDGVVLVVEGDRITFDLSDGPAEASAGKSKAAKKAPKAVGKSTIDKSILGKSKIEAGAIVPPDELVADKSVAERKITVTLSDIERARLIPDI